MTPEAAGAERVTKATVLIVDDEENLRLTLEKFLQADGYRTESVASAQQACAWITRQPCDIVVSDIILPQVSGMQLLAQLRTLAPDSYVLMMTGEPKAATIAEALRLGAFDYLVKPITKSAVLRAVGNALRVKQLHDAQCRLEQENRGYAAHVAQLTADLAAIREVAQRVSDLLPADSPVRDDLYHILRLAEREMAVR